jgi:hypothetical protein
MKSFYLDYLLLIIAWGISSCGVKQSIDDAPQSLFVTQESFVEKAYSSKIFSSINCVSLNTTDDLLIDNIIKIIHKDNLIYVADRYALYKFDENGDVLGTIKKNGRGPDEYLSVSDFEIDTNETVWILSRSEKKLYQYTWDSEMKRDMELNCWVSKIHLISPEEMYLYIGNERDENNQHQLKKINQKTNIVINNYLEIDEKKAKFLHVNSVNHFSKELKNEGVYFFNIFDDGVSKLFKDTISSAFQVDIIKKSIPASFFDNEYKDVSEFFQFLLKGNFAYGTTLFVEYENQYLFSYYYDQECHIALISKETKESILDFRIIVEDKYLLGYPINLTEQNIFIQQNNELIIPLIPSDIMQYAEKELSVENKNKLKQIIHYKDEDQNPVLLIVNI